MTPATAFTSLDPTTGHVVDVHPPHGPDEVEARLTRAADAFAEWRRASLGDRLATLRRLADLLDADAGVHAAHITREMGKPTTQALAEVHKCAATCRHYADHAATYLADTVVPTEATTSYVRYDPVGPILAIMPWNFPYFQVIRFLAPLVAAGNVTLLKHAPITMGSGERLAEAAAKAGVPDGVVQTLRIHPDVAADVIADRRVQGITFTGSTAGGRAVAALAGAAGKRSLLELGGSDPVVVLVDADVELAAQKAVASRLFNSGQSCIAAKRFLVDRRVADEFTQAAVAAFDDAVIGDPMQTATDVGPLARDDLRDVLARQIAQSTVAGARVARDGGRRDGPGWWFDPVLLVDVSPAHPVFREETFGPVGTVSTFTDEDEAIRLANDTEYGLGASVWTGDLERGEQVAAQIDAGTIAVNDIVRSDPRLPFGGTKASGYGRELGAWGIREFTNAKTVWAQRP